MRLLPTYVIDNMVIGRTHWQASLGRLDDLTASRSVAELVPSVLHSRLFILLVPGLPLMTNSCWWWFRVRCTFLYEVSPFPSSQTAAGSKTVVHKIAFGCKQVVSHMKRNMWKISEALAYRHLCSD